MDFNFDLRLVQSQKLILTPQLRQALEVLRMSSQELFDYIEDQLETNPVLELVDSEACLETDEDALHTKQDDWDQNSELHEIGMNGRISANTFDLEDITVDRSTVKLSLKDHLLFQLHTSDIEKKEAMVAQYFIDNTDENGYLTIRLADAARFFNMPIQKVEEVLHFVQTFDPSGVCARDLKECLLIQLKQMGSANHDAITMVENFLDELASNKLSWVAKQMGISTKEVSKTYNFIKSLEPKPGREFYDTDDIKFIIPDIMVRKINGKFEVLMNEDSNPVLNINRYYREIIQEDINIEAKKFIQNKMDDAAWLVKCIEERKMTVKKIADCIVHQQEQFFEKGKGSIKPLTMDNVAKKVGMHASTVSRTVNGKYIQCRWGVFEMRYFFTTQIPLDSGEGLSTRNIKISLKKMIDDENKTNPLSDQKIKEIFEEKGIGISRRTVAKYRTELGIPPSSRRKEYE